MNINILIALVLIGLVTGTVSGFLGLSGGVMLIPALVIFIGLSQKDAIGTSLAVMLPPIGFFAAYNFYKAGHVNIKYALILAVMFMIGSYFTSKLAIKVPEQLLRKIFSVFLVLIAIKIYFSK
jgi:uncharacterized membrane protein YfcA